jgi:hypothetical protein
MTKRFLGNLKTFGASSSYSSYFPGVATSYLQIPPSFDVWPNNNNFTMEMYVYPQTVNTIVGFMSLWGATTGQYIIRRNASNQLEFVYNLSGTGTTTATGTNALIRSWKWNHICVVRSGSSLVLFVDGVVALSTTITDSISFSDTTTPLRIGVDQNLTNPFLGYISNVRFCMTDNVTAGQIYPLTGFPPPMALAPVTSDCKILTCNTEVIQNNSNSATFRSSCAITAFGVSPTYIQASDFTPYASSAPLSYPIFGPNTANYVTTVPAGAAGGYMNFPMANSTFQGSANLGMLTLADVAMSASQGNLSNYDPLNSNNLVFTTAIINANPSGTNNHTFIDSSPLNASVSRFGNATQGTFTPYYPLHPATSWATYITSGNTYFGTTTTAPGTASCTYEFFCNMDNLSTGKTAFMNTRSGDTTDGFDFYAEQGTSPTSGLFKISYTGVELFASTTGGWLREKQWHHVAVVFNGTALSIYVDGVIVPPSPVTITGGRTFTSTTLQIAYTPSQGQNFRGYISNFRYLQGVAQYTTTFTPPTVPLGIVTSSSVTRILAFQNYSVQDNSGNNAVFVNTNNGSVQLPAAVTSNALLPPPDQVTVGGSAYFDGTGDYLSLPSSTDYAPGTGDFSLDCWIMPAVFGSTRNIIYNSAARWYLEISSTGVLTTFDGTTTFTFGTLVACSWYHIAITKVGTQARCFLNGRLTATAVTSYTSTAAQTFLVGGNTTTNPFSGYISGVRFVKGGIPTLFSTASTTLNTQVFTPQLTPLTGTEARTGGTLNLLLDMDNYAVADSMRRCNFETMANFTTSNTVTKFGNKSMFFDGSTTGYIQGTSTGNFTLQSNSMCIDLWFYPTSLAANSYLIDINNGGGTARFTIRVNTNGTVQTLTGTGAVPATSIQTTSINPLVVGKWYHIAVVRFVNFMGIYIDGVASILPANLNTAYFSSSTTFVAIGGTYSATRVGGACTGYIQNVRVTNGHPRFTNAINLGEGFTPPIGPAAVQ